jgi:hypothetical protein
MSLVVFCQTFDGSLFLTFAQTIFSRSLIDGLKKYAPTVNAQAVITADATAIRQVVKPEGVPGVLEAYNLAIIRDLYPAAGAPVGAFMFCWGWAGIVLRRRLSPREA